MDTNSSLATRDQRAAHSHGNIIEVPAIARPRQYTTEYKLKILDEMDKCTGPGQCAALARREGIYSSTLSKWKEWRNKMNHGHTPSGNGEKDTSRSADRNRIRQLERENNRLTLKLKKTEGLIALQKKALELLDIQDPND